MTDKPKIKFCKQNEAAEIPLQKTVKVTKMKHIMEVLSVSSPCNNLKKYRKLDKFRYLELDSVDMRIK